MKTRRRIPTCPSPHILLLLILALCLHVSGQPSHPHHHHRQSAGSSNDTHDTGNNTQADAGTDMVCVPFGACEPCPATSLHEPFCQPFGTRRLMHCSPASSHPPSSESPSQAAQPNTRTIPAFESCGRIPSLERYDFFEFIAVNFSLGACAVGAVVWRMRIGRARQLRVVAARIGLIGGGGAGGVTAVAGTPGGWREMAG